MRVRSFRGGAHPPERKDSTAGLPVADAPLPPELVVHLHQHTGAPCSPLVSKGDRVRAGQKIGDAEAFISAPVHAPASGTVKVVEPRLHFTGARVPAVVIQADGEQEAERFDVPSGEPSAEDVRRLVREAGIVGLGGAAFPTHVKLSPPKDKPLDTLIVNGCECEPYLTCDHRNMLERADRLLDGISLIAATVGTSRTVIAVEANKPDAAAAFTGLGGAVEVAVLPVRYPQGAEKQLIRAVTGRIVPAGKLPMEVGVLVQNVGTTIAVSEAVREGKPLIDRVVTVTGEGVARPANLRVRVGTPVSFLAELCGGFTADLGKLIMGGPMTGFALFDPEVPVVKGTSGILALRGEDVPAERTHQCIRCARCVESCPMLLVPSFIGDYARVEQWDLAEAADVMDCIECGCCAYVCPSRIPLVQMFRVAKARIIAARQARKWKEN